MGLALAAVVRGGGSGSVANGGGSSFPFQGAGNGKDTAACISSFRRAEALF